MPYCGLPDRTPTSAEEQAYIFGYDQAAEHFPAPPELIALRLAEFACAQGYLDFVASHPRNQPAPPEVTPS